MVSGHAFSPNMNPTHTQRPISDAGTERPPHTPCSCVASPSQGPGAEQIQSWPEVILTCPASEGLL